MSAVTIEYDARARRFEFWCDCAWTGHTRDLAVVTQPIAEHLRVCDGTRPSSRKPYNADRFDRSYTVPLPAEDD